MVERGNDIMIALIFLQVSAIPIGVELRKYAIKKRMSNTVVAMIDVSLMALLAVLTLSVVNMVIR